MITFTVQGKPQAWQRRRMGRGGRSYTPPETDAYEQAVALQLLAAMRGRRDALVGCLRVEVTAVYHRPKAPPKGATKAAWATGDRLPHVGRSDVDNVAKAVLDGIGRVLGDDRRVVVLVARKVCAAAGEQECTEVSVGRAA